MMEEIQKYKTIVVDGENYIQVSPEYLKYLGEKHYDIRLKHSNILSEYLQWNWNDYLGEKSRKEVEQLKKYVEKVREDNFKQVKVLYIHGHEKRVQKTTVACILGKALIKEGFVVKYMKFHKIINAILKTTGYSNHEEFENEINYLIKSDYIIMDESFSKSSSILFKSYEANLEIISKLDYFIRDYLDNGGKFIITSNESFESIGDIYGERIHKMLEENMIEFEMKDLVSENKKSKLSKELLFG